MEFRFKPIGTIHTPYISDAPFQDYSGKEGEFYIRVHRAYEEGLYLLDRFNYLHILFGFHKPAKSFTLRVHPPRANGREAGLFASRSPHRVNPIGLTIARIKKIEKNIIYTSGLDILDGTPLLDIKPYIPDTDLKEDANTGWIGEL